MRQHLARLKALLDHDLSPAPIFAVFVGYWLPLDWMLSSGILAGATALERAYAVASSAVFNYGFSGVVLSALTYLIAGTVSLFGFPFRVLVRRGMGFCTLLVFLSVTALSLKRLTFQEIPVPPELRWILIGITIVAALFMTLKDWDPREALVLPMGLGVTMLPAVMILVVCEAAGIGQLTPLRIAGPAASRPDILLITLDATSARHLTMYGSSRPTTPNLQMFADGAITLDHFQADANWTRPGIASILNGARPWTHQGDLGSPRQAVVDAQNLLKELALAGYDTEVVSTNPFAGPYLQNLQAFVHRLQVIDGDLFSFFKFPKRLPSLARGLAVGPFFRLSGVILNTTRSRSIEKIKLPIQTAETFLATPSGGSRFLWLHLITAHDPYAPPSPFIGCFEPSRYARSVKATQAHYGFGAASDPCFPNIYEGRYDEALLCMDDGLGSLFAWLKATGRYDRTLIVITADHGESFTHGYGGHGGPLLSEDLIHIPCMIKPPFYKGAARDDRLYEQADLAPTILQLVGLPVPASMEGYPIPQKPEGLPVFSMNHDLQLGTRTFSVAIRLGDWKYVEHWGHWTAPWPQEELYDLASDPGEDRNLVAARPDMVADLRGRILAELARRHIDPEKE
jgi:arylsulfatase A-like enzyme